MATRKNTTTVIQRKGKCIYAKISDFNESDSHRIGTEKIGEDKYTKKFNALKKSIAANGLFTPLLVKKEEDGTYTIIDGFRRYEVAKILGMKKVQVVVYSDIKEKEAILGLIANSNQKALTPIELGMAYKRLIARKVYKDEKELAKALGLSANTINSKINNLKLDSRIIEDMLTGDGINDQKILKALRGLATATENTLDEEQTENVSEEQTKHVSEEQWEAYTQIKEKALNREKAIERIKELKEPSLTNNVIEPTEPFVRDETEKEIRVTIEKEGLTAEVISQIEALLAEVESLSQVANNESAA